LLVSTQAKTQRMPPVDSKRELTKLKNQSSLKFNNSLKKDVILCKHCKRTASNGVRCLGMCVADNDY